MIRKGKLVLWVLPLAALVALAFASSAGATHNLFALVSTGPVSNGPNDAHFADVSDVGTRFLFETDEKVVAADTDSVVDLYERVSSTTTLLSTGPSGGNGAIDVFYTGSSKDASHAYFETDEKLVASDNDGGQGDVYERVGGTTNLVSQGTGGNGAFSAFFVGVSDNGGRVFFETDEALSASDTDGGQQDVYERVGGTTNLVSTGGNGAFLASFAGASADGTKVLFVTDESLGGGDVDGLQDIYMRSGGTTTLISTGSANNGAFAANFESVTADGSRVVFKTAEKVEPLSDTDAQLDLYERVGSTTSLVSTGPIGGNGAFGATWGGISSDGSHIVFETSEKLTADDLDLTKDVYDRSGGSTTRVSTGTSGGNATASATFEGVSDSGARVFFNTTEQVETSDTDTVKDIYERAGTTTSRVSTGPLGGNGAVPAAFLSSSLDGTRAFFETGESLETADTDSSTDIYERTAGGTTRISTGAIGGNANSANAVWWGSSDDGRRAFFDTVESLSTADTDSAIDVYVAVSNLQFPRPGGGTPLRVPLVPAYSACTSPNSSHIGPLAEPSCSPPVLQSPRLTTSSVGRGLGSVILSTIVGNPSTPADEANVSIQVSLTDVLNTSGGTEYTGDVMLSSQFRITDNASGFTGEEAATGQDTEFSFRIDCVSTPDPALGGACNATTTADSLVPGYILETNRTTISAFTLEVLDAGADGSVIPGSGCPANCGTGDEQRFAVQGAFLP